MAEEEAARADVVECRRRGKGQEGGEGGEKGWVPEREADRCARDGGEARENRRSVSLTNLRVTEKRRHMCFCILCMDGKESLSLP